MKTAYLLLLFVICITKAHAQQDADELITDRPDQTESASVVPLRSLQIESGFMLDADETGIRIIRGRVYNTTLLRFGLMERIELRAGLEHLGEKVKIKSTGETRASSGIGPFYAGTKIEISKENGPWPQIAFLGGFVLPFTAAEEFRPEYTAVTFRFAFAHTLSDRLSLGYNLGADWDGNTGRPSLVYSIAFGITITDKFGTFVENYGVFPERGNAEHLIDAGITFLVLNNLQLDASAGLGLTDNAADRFISLGVTYRIPR